MKTVIYIVLIALAVPLVILLLDYAFMRGWNYTMPYLFGFKEIGFWHAFWITFMGGMLFKNIGYSSKS